MKQTVVGVFDRYESARHAANLLQDSGFGPEAVHLADGTGEEGGTAPAEHRGAWDSIRSFFAEVFGSERDSQEHMDAYAEALRRGCAVVKVDVDDEPRVDRARQLLESAGAVNIDERVAEWREQGWSGEVDAAAFDRLRDDGALGTRAVAGGDSGPSDAGSVGMPASEQIGAMRSAAHADDVDRLARDAGRLLTRARDADADVRDWRDDWQRQYAALGGRYEDYDPAYRWGHTLRSDARWQGRDWDDIEPELRGEWERGHPGSAWDRFKAAVRHGWERVTG
ncbi:MAG TPA: hypothetical protein VLU41_03745 [Ideonella sp.]|nr:hypothetical protein [Ideonella sp.]